jgi:hypothetical protein
MRSQGKTLEVICLTVVLFTIVALFDNPVSMGADKLEARAVLEAATFAEGPTSGALLGSEPLNGQEVPFLDKQPVQGFSAVLDNGDGTFLAMSETALEALRTPPITTCVFIRYVLTSKQKMAAVATFKF